MVRPANEAHPGHGQVAVSGRTIRAVGIVGLLLVVALPLSSCGGNGLTGETVRKGVTTISTAPPSVPALPRGITADQIKDLLARKADGGMTADEWQVRDYKNLEDWAVACVYSDAFINQDGCGLRVPWISGGPCNAPGPSRTWYR